MSPRDIDAFDRRESRQLIHSRPVTSDNKRLAPPRFLRNRSGEPGHQGMGAGKETAVLRSCRPGGRGGRVASLETLADICPSGRERRATHV
jgi:hypothetical protein